jgi:hypothetical protein
MGIGKLSVNWTTGACIFSPFSIQLFGFGMSCEEYSPWIISFSLPLGAILFIIKQKQLSCVERRGGAVK